MLNSSMFFFRRLLNFVNPEPIIGGLEIRSNLLHFSILKGKNLISASVRLPPQTIQEGRIKNREAFGEAVRDLHNKISSLSKQIYVILDIPDNDIYTHVFSLPAVPNGQLKEAAALNLQIISPIPYGEVYADWEKMGSAGNGEQIEILGVFSPKVSVDEFSEALQSANFVVVAVEFSGLAFSRLIKFSKNEKFSSIVFVRLTGEGMNFFIFRREHLYFSHFVSWSAQKAAPNFLEEMILREAKRVIQFYSSHWAAPLDGVVYVASSPIIKDIFENKLEKEISFPVIPFDGFLEAVFRENGINSAGNESPVSFGSALRGAMPRFKDNMISLASYGTKQKFEHLEFLSFIRLWRTIILATLSFLVLVFAGADLFLSKIDALIQSQAGDGELSDIKEFQAIKEMGLKVNQTIAFAREARDARRSPAFLIQKLQADGGINIDRIYMQSENLPVVVNAKAPDEQSIADFRENLAKDSSFLNIDLPLSAIKKGSDGILNFTLTVQLAPDLFRVSDFIISPASGATSTL